MAILGGGPPIGSGNSFTGVSESIELVGDHFYCYSGLIQASTTEAEVLAFTTGNYYCVGEVQVNSPLSQTNPLLAGIAAAHVKLNGIGIAGIKSGGSEQADDNPTSERMAIIIPPYTEVSVTTDSNVSTADSFSSITIIGRIYRG